MLKSLLLHLDRTEHAAPVIRAGIDLGLQTDARVRGLTLLDTRRARESLHSESPVYAILEQSRRDRTALRQEAVRGELSRACLAAGLDFDVRRATGDPLQILPRESQFHDLVITSPATIVADGDRSTDLSHDDIIELLERGMRTLLVVPPERTSFRRVLLAYDGGESARHAIRAFLGLEILAGAAHRLLAVGPTVQTARSRLREMADYCLHRRPELETGCVCGSMRRALPSIAERWDADLIVVGMPRGGKLMRLLRGDVVRDLLKQGSFGLFLAV
jgi:nucleotide-binding universal stress UspA family protein